MDSRWDLFDRRPGRRFVSLGGGLVKAVVLYYVDKSDLLDILDLYEWIALRRRMKKAQRRAIASQRQLIARR
jgi:hypothetical protein